MPKYFGTSIIAIITLNVAIGYELNVSLLPRQRWLYVPDGLTTLAPGGQNGP